jgi:3-methyladenine DNA glycosylase AlkD
MARRTARVPGNAAQIIAEVRSLGTAENRQGMKRFGIRPETELLGVSMTDLRRIAGGYQQNHDLAADLWSSGIHEVRILAGLLDEPDSVTSAQMDHWAHDFDSWDICDQTCQNLFRYTPFVEVKAYEWVTSPNEFVKRAGFVIMATSAVKGSLDDGVLLDFLPTLVNGMTDERNFVKKAVSWSFRQIGKRDALLRQAVLDTVTPFVDDPDKTARWIAKDVMKELRRH